jgi:hypothetical protein
MQRIPPEFFSFINEFTTGITNAAVLPVPVCAIASTSSPLRIGGIALNCISVGLLNPIESRFFLMIGLKLDSSKRMFSFPVIKR